MLTAAWERPLTACEQGVGRVPSFLFRYLNESPASVCSSSGGSSSPGCCNTGYRLPAQYIRWNESRSKSVRAVWSIIPNGMDLTILNLKNTSLDRSKLLTFSVLYGRKEWAKLSEFLSLGRVRYSVHAGATCLFLRLSLLTWPASWVTGVKRAEGLLERTQGVGSTDDPGKASSPRLKEVVMVAPEPCCPHGHAWKLCDFPS